MSKTQRIDKVLANLGYGSRKDIRKICKSGLVKIDGRVVKDSSLHIEPEKCEIIIGNEVVNYREFVYIMMNKPQGVISATEDKRDETVVDLLDESYIPFDIFPVGRLDKDTEGLLLLTNDGSLTHSLIHPSKKIDKTYIAKITGKPLQEKIDLLRVGIELDDGMTAPAVINVIDYEDERDLTSLQITIHEGRNRQIRRMFAAIGYDVKQLKRTQFAFLTLEGVKRGAYRHLTAREVDELHRLNK